MRELEADRLEPVELIESGGRVIATARAKRRFPRRLGGDERIVTRVFGMGEDDELAGREFASREEAVEALGGAGRHAVVARSGYEAFAAHDVDGFARSFSTDAELIPAMGAHADEVLTGREQIAMWLRELLDTFPDIEFRPRDFVESGESLAVIGIARGTDEAGHSDESEFAHLMRFRGEACVLWRNCGSRDEALTGLVESSAA